MNWTLHDIALAGLVGALGLGFPIALHMLGAGQIGRIFLPMFLPIVAGAFFLPVALAILVGVATPLLSSLLTGMPPLAPPIAFLMMGELGAMAAVIALLHRRAGVNPWLALAAGVVVDRAILALLAAGLSPAFGLPPALVTWGSLVMGFPGIVLLFVVIPPLVARLRNRSEESTDAGRG